MSRRTRQQEINEIQRSIDRWVNYAHQMSGSARENAWKRVEELEDELDVLEGRVDDDGPPDDSWIQATLERAAGVGEPDRSYYDGGRLIRP